MNAREELFRPVARVMDEVCANKLIDAAIAEVLETTATRIERRGRRLGGEWIRTDQVVAVMREIAAARDFTDPMIEKDGAR